MINRHDSHDALESWEKWPLAALFLANALNIFILYVPQEEMPPSIQWLLPWARVFCGLAAAASLEGTLIAVTMGRRLGRDSWWSWAAMFAASVFTAAVAYYIHSSIGLGAAALFMAQAVVLFIYTQHLAQPRKGLHRVNSDVRARLETDKPTDLGIVAVSGYTCRRCGISGFATLADVRRHQTASPSECFDVVVLADRQNGHKEL